MRILLLDDYEPFLEMLERRISGEFGSSVIVDKIASKDDYMELEGTFYDILFLDWVIDGEKAGSTATRVVNEVPHEEGYLLSGYTNNQDAMDFMSLYKIKPLSKPVGIEKIFKIIKDKITLEDAG